MSGHEKRILQFAIPMVFGEAEVSKCLRHWLNYFLTYKNMLRAV